MSVKQVDEGLNGVEGAGKDWGATFASGTHVVVKIMKGNVVFICRQ